MSWYSLVVPFVIFEMDWTETIKNSLPSRHDKYVSSIREIEMIFVQIAIPI